MAERTLPTRSLAAALALVALGGVVATAAVAAPVAQPANEPAVHSPVEAPPDDNATDRGPIEDEFVVPAPEEGDPYFEAAASDGSWISYTNPRDEYRDPYLGEASGKICVTLLNEDGEVVAGEAVPNTTVTVPTGETLEWHSHADPIEVEYPLTDNYDRPLDADQFGTSADLPQGDGYMDSHCVEFHGPKEDAEISYGEARVEGERADRIDVVGYVQQANDAWDSDVDPLAEAVPHDQAGGWTNYPDGSHGQAVVVLQLDPPADAYDDGEGGATPGDGNESGEKVTDPGDGNVSEPGDENESVGNASDPADGNESDGNTTSPEDDGPSTAAENEADAAGDPLPGFGVRLALAALSVAALARTRR